MFRTRFAPSPTGLLHLGNARVALLNMLWAKQNAGSLYLRIDDTDVSRGNEHFVNSLKEDLSWLGLRFERKVRQSERTELYTRHIRNLIDKKYLYKCYETPEELAEKRQQQRKAGKPPRYNRESRNLSVQEQNVLQRKGCKPYWRFLLNDQAETWHDAVRGKIVYQTSALSDPVVVRADGTPTFLLTGSVDDLELDVTHVLRGEDHISNTAIQQQIMRALKPSFDITFGHLPLLVDENGRALSKRLGSLTIQALKEQDFFSDSVRDFLLTLGTPYLIRDYPSLEEHLKVFNLAHYGGAQTRLSLKDLSVIQEKRLRGLPSQKLRTYLEKSGRTQSTEAFIELIRENLLSLEDLYLWYDICFTDTPFSLQEEHDAPFLQQARNTLPDEPWDEKTWTAWTEVLLSQTKWPKKKLYLALRKRLTGKNWGPNMTKLLPILGAQRVYARLNNNVPTTQY